MRKTFVKLAGIFVLAAAVALLGLHYEDAPVKAQSGGSRLSRVAGVYDATQYSQWGASIISGNTATGSQTITVCPAYQALPDGRLFSPLSAPNSNFVPITIDPQNASVVETVTPTAVSIIPTPALPGAPPGSQCANITASFSNLHGASLNQTQVISGDSGIMEAVNDASNNGGGSVYWQVDCGNVTLSTSGATTTTTCNVPKTFTNLGASVNVKTTITTSASYSLGIASATTAFVSACTALTAGTTCSQFVAAPGKTSQGTGFGALLITANATAGAGVIHPRVWGYIGAQSAN